MEGKNKKIEYPVCWCGENDYEPILTGGKNGFEILGCRSCGLARTWPVPDASVERYADYPIVAYRQNKKILMGFMRQLLRLVLKYKQGGQLLEIGSGAGYFLKIAQKHFAVKGLELSRAGAALSAKNLGPNVVQRKTLLRAASPDGFFTVVVLNHVLEHVADLGGLLAEINRVLEPGGLLVLGAPNFGGWFARWRKIKWPGLRPKEHVWQFTPQSLRQILKANGFVLRATKQKASHNQASIFSRSNFSPRQFVLRIVNWLFGLLGRGDNLLVVAQRVEYGR